jgi:3-oxoacyl-[acyl-carrier-protein] synthase III
MSFIAGVRLTAFGKHEASSTLDLMSKAAELALADAGLKRGDIGGLLCGYSTLQYFHRKVTAQYRPLTGRLVPHFGRTPP